MPLQAEEVIKKTFSVSITDFAVVVVLLFEYLSTVIFHREIVNSKNFIDWLKTSGP